MVLDPSKVGEISEFLCTESAILGLKLNFKNCEVMSMNGLTALTNVVAHPDIKKVSWVKNLGILIGPDHLCGDYWQSFLDDISSNSNCLPLEERTCCAGPVSSMYNIQT